MEPAADSPPRRSPLTTAIAVATLLVAALGLAFLLYAFADSPQPPPAGQISRAQAQRNVESAANAYASALLDSARSAPLTSVRARGVPAPRGTTVSVVNVGTEGTATVVTFLLHKGYGRPESPHEVVACYKLALSGSGTGRTPSNWSFRPESTSACRAT